MINRLILNTDSGYISGASGQPTPNKSPQDFSQSITNICSQFAAEIIQKIHDDCIQKCDTVEKCKKVLWKAGISDNQLASLDKLTMKDLLDNPPHIKQVFVGVCEGSSILPTLKFIQDCHLCHPRNPAERSKFLSAVGQVRLRDILKLYLDGNVQLGV